MTHHPPETGSPTYETPAIPARTIVRWGVALVVLIVVSFSLMAMFLKSLGTSTEISPVTAGEPDPLARSTAALDPNQQLTRRNYELRQQELLGSYGWVDDRKQTAHIPIRRAMELTVQRYQSESPSAEAATAEK